MDKDIILGKPVYKAFMKSLYTMRHLKPGHLMEMTIESEAGQAPELMWKEWRRENSGK
jgi:hypothetical protein